MRFYLFRVMSLGLETALYTSREFVPVLLDRHTHHTLT